MWNISAPREPGQYCYLFFNKQEWVSPVFFVDQYRSFRNPDSTFHFDADPDSNPNTAPSFSHIGKSEKFSTFIHSISNLHCFIFLFSVIGIVIFNAGILTVRILKFSGKFRVMLYIWLKWIRIRIRPSLDP
jgi:hypothetical protein